MTTHIVSNTQEILDAFDNCEPGDTIALQPGTYDSVRLWSQKYDAVSDPNNPITFTSLDPENPAEIMGLSVGGMSNIIFEDLKFSFDIDKFNEDVLKLADPADVQAWSTYTVKLENTKNITFQDVVFEGQYAKYGVEYDDLTSPNPTDAILGLPFGGQVDIRYSENVTIRDSELTKLQVGIRVNGVDGLIIENNEIYDLRSTPIGGGNVNNVLISNNNMYEINPRFIEGYDLDHADFIHFFPRPGIQQGSQDNITITNNIMLQGEGAAILGIYLDDDGTGLGYTNATIQNNVLHNGDSQGIRLEHVMDSLIANNTLLPADDGLGRPGINVLDYSQNVTIADNVLGHLTIYGGAFDISDSGNLIVQRTNPYSENYYGDLFANPFDAQIDLADLMVMPGSELDGLGVGASQTWIPETATAPIGAIHTEPGTGLYKLTHTFDVAAAIGPNGAINLERAEYQWNFGGGETSDDPAPRITFESPGLKVIEVTVYPQSGPSFVLQRTVDVKSPFALEVDGTRGAQDQSYQENAATLLADDPVVSLDGRATLDLQRPVSYQVDDELRSRESYTVSFDFKREGAATGPAELINLDGSFRLAIDDGDDIWGSVTTVDADGNRNTDWIKVLDTGIDDNEWHNMTLTFSGETGVVALYLDGSEIFQATGLFGFEQYNVNGKNLVIGATTNSDTYYMDDLYILTGAVTEQQAAEIVNGKSVEDVVRDGQGPTKKELHTLDPQILVLSGLQEDPYSTPVALDPKGQPNPLPQNMPAVTDSTDGVTAQWHWDAQPVVDTGLEGDTPPDPSPDMEGPVSDFVFQWEDLASVQEPTASFDVAPDSVDDFVFALDVGHQADPIDHIDVRWERSETEPAIPVAIEPAYDSDLS